jgi:hypothetical protein
MRHFVDIEGNDDARLPRGEFSHCIRDQTSSLVSLYASLGRGFVRRIIVHVWVILGEMISISFCGAQMPSNDVSRYATRPRVEISLFGAKQANAREDRRQCLLHDVTNVFTPHTVFATFERDIALEALDEERFEGGSFEA